MSESKGIESLDKRFSELQDAVPAQGQAMEVLRYIKGYLQERDDWPGTGPLISDIDRALVAASPCAAQPTRIAPDPPEQECPHCELPALRSCGKHCPMPDVPSSFAAAQGGQQPAKAWMRDDGEVASAALKHSMENHQGVPGKRLAATYTTPLYTAPAGSAAPLTEEQVADIWHESGYLEANHMKALWAYSDAIQRACAAKWGITLAGTAQKESE